MALRCIIVDDDELSLNILQDLVNESSDLELVMSCDNSMDAYKLLTEGDIDLAFLDIEMPKMSGMDLLKNLDSSTQVILVTSHTEYAIESYEYEVTDFIAKPVTTARFLKAVEKAVKKATDISGNDQAGKKLFIKADSRLVQLDPERILYVEALGNYVNIYTEKERLTVHFTMKDIAARLSGHDFLRVHRSYIVKLDRIESIEDNTIAIGGKQIAIGRAYKEDLLKRLQMF